VFEQSVAFRWTNLVTARTTKAILVERADRIESKEIDGRESVTLSRDPGNDIVVNWRNVSRRHAVIAGESDGYWITNLGSRNGTYVNDELVVEPRMLRNLDRIHLGGAESVGWVFMESAETVRIDARRRTIL